PSLQSLLLPVSPALKTCRNTSRKSPAAYTNHIIGLLFSHPARMVVVSTPNLKVYLTKNVYVVWAICYSSSALGTHTGRRFMRSLNTQLRCLANS
ncbi:hypothetical protein C0991_010915, partial [Blastosporella zonata]